MHNVWCGAQAGSDSSELEAPRSAPPRGRGGGGWLGLSGSKHGAGAAGWLGLWSMVRGSRGQSRKKKGQDDEPAQGARSAPFLSAEHVEATYVILGQSNLL